MNALPLLRTTCLAAALAAAACSRSSDKVTIDLRRSTQGTPVATYSGGVITAEDVNKALAQLPPMVRLRYQGPAQKKEFVERLVTLDLLAHEAVRQGHANDPEVVETLKNVLAQKLVKDERENKTPPVTDEEVQAWYDAHAADFTRPETWRVSTIFLAIPPNDEAKQKAQMAKAEKLLAQVQKLKPDDFSAFGQLAKANSDDPSKVLEGDLRALTAADLTSRYGAEVAQAAQALKEPGDLSGLVRAKTGVHILKLRVHSAQTLQGLADVKGQIRTRLQNDHRNQAYEKFVGDLKAKSGLKVDEPALAKVVVDVSPRPEGQAGPRTMVQAPPAVSFPVPAPAPALTPVPPPPVRQ
jgi:peptidyl-prolyl cis-trans isomerase C